MKKPAAQWTLTDPRHFKEGYTLSDGKQVAVKATTRPTVNKLPIIKR